MSTAFQPNAFQPDAFQVEGGVPSGAITGGMAYTNRDDVFAGTAVLATDDLLSAKFLGRPNVVIKPLRDLMPKPQPPLPAEITNMPDAVPVALARGMDLGLLPPDQVIAPTPAPVEPEMRAAAPKAKPPVAPISEPATQKPAVPAPVLAEAVEATPAPVEEVLPPDPQTVAMAGLIAQVSAAQLGIEALLAEMQELRAQLGDQQRKRALEAKNSLRAQELTRKILEDLMNSE